MVEKNIKITILHVETGIVSLDTSYLLAKVNSISDSFGPIRI